MKTWSDDLLTYGREALKKVSLCARPIPCRRRPSCEPSRATSARGPPRQSLAEIGLEGVGGWEILRAFLFELLFCVVRASFAENCGDLDLRLKTIHKSCGDLRETAQLSEISRNPQKRSLNVRRANLWGRFGVKRVWCECEVTFQL